MSTRLHSHLKHFIHQVVLTEMTNTLGPSKGYAWKEALMRKIQEKILGDLAGIENQNQLNEKIDLHVAEFAKEIETTLKMISRTLKSLDVNMLKGSPVTQSTSFKK